MRKTTSSSPTNASACRILPGNDLVLALQACWLRAVEQAAAAAAGGQPQVAACLQLLQARVGKKAAGVLASDEDDLFFEGGRHRKGFLRGLVSRRGP